jgi:hypothetical protein
MKEEREIFQVGYTISSYFLSPVYPMSSVRVYRLKKEERI